MQPQAATHYADTLPDVGLLRDYQREALEAALVHGWGRVALATNAGKGAVMGLLTRFALDTGRATLILCDEVEVFQALSEEVRNWGRLEPFFIQAGAKDPPPDNVAVTVAMVPTLRKRLSGDDSKRWEEWIGRHQMLLLDEADKATANGWRNVLSFATAAEWRLGFSGTFPDPKEDPIGALLLDELMGPILAQIKNVALIERKISAKAIVHLYAFDGSGLLPFDENKRWYQGRMGSELRAMVYDRVIINNEERHTFIRDLMRPDTPTVIVVNRVEHGRLLAQVVSGEFLDGSSKGTKRTQTLERFGRGEIMVLVVTKILDRGSNRLGRAADLILASAEGSNRQNLQRIGRGLRRTDGKEFLRVVDIIDRGHDFLHTMAQKRVALYNAEGFEVRIQK